MGGEGGWGGGGGITAECNFLVNDIYIFVLLTPQVRLSLLNSDLPLPPRLVFIQTIILNKQSEWSIVGERDARHNNT